MPSFSRFYAIRDYPFTNGSNQCCGTGGDQETVVTIEADYVVDPNDMPLVIHLAPASQTILVTLPWPLEPPPLGGAGSYIRAVDIVGLGNNGQVVDFVSSDNPNGTGQGSTIGGGSTYSMSGNFQSVRFDPETANPNWLVT